MTNVGIGEATGICEEFLNASMELNDLPGLAIGVSAGGEHCRFAAGIRDTLTGEKLEEGDVFHCASVSKLFTSTAIMKLIDDGSLNYEDRLLDILPDLAFADERAKDIRLWQMLSHTSGIGDVTDYRWQEALTGETALSDYVRSDEVCKLPSLWEPGKGGFRYSNIAYEILGHIVSVKSGLSYEDFVQKNLMDPAGMTSSTMKTYERIGVAAGDECPLINDEIRRLNKSGAGGGASAGDIWQPMALPHEKNESRKIVPVKYYPYTRAHGPSSTLTSTLEDLLRWADLHLAGFSKAIEQSDNAGIISTDAYIHIGYEYATVPNNGEKMGLGWFMREQKGYRLYGHEGTDDGFRASLWICPELDLAIAVLSNLSGAPVKKLNKKLFDRLTADQS